MPHIEPFERYAAEYDDWFEEHPAAYESELNAVRELLPREGIGIEIGVGTGRFAAELGVGRGVEPSGAMRSVAEARGIDVVEATAEAMPFPADTFDFALMVTTVCFLDDVGQAFDETYRVLKKGGVFVVGLIDRKSPLGWQYDRKKEGSGFYRDAHFHSTDEVAAAMLNAGFEELAFRQTLFGDLSAMTSPDVVRPGYGSGGFVVIRGTKRP